MYHVLKIATLLISQSLSHQQNGSQFPHEQAIPILYVWYLYSMRQTHTLKFI